MSQEENVSPAETGRMRAQIVSLLLDHPDGLTCDEIEVLLDMRHQTASARLKELKDPPIAYVRTTQEKRETRSGRFAFVNVLTEKAKGNLL